MDVPLMDLSPLPALTISTSSDEVAIEAVKNVGRRFQSDAPEHRMSVLQDIERGTRIEIEETLGFALDRARSFDLSVPTLELCLGLLRVGRSD
jgi:ketopantoate reductase